MSWIWTEVLRFMEKRLVWKNTTQGSDRRFVHPGLPDRQRDRILLELTWLRDRKEAYELGDNESHLCFRVAGDYDKVREYHRELGYICFENNEMGLYFINDPDDYWIEILPAK